MGTERYTVAGLIRHEWAGYVTALLTFIDGLLYGAEVPTPDGGSWEAALGSFHVVTLYGEGPRFPVST